MLQARRQDKENTRATASPRCPQLTARLVRTHKLIVAEELAPSNMTASAKGTAEKPGRNVKAKAGLNRAIRS